MSSTFDDMTEEETFVPAAEAMDRLGLTEARLMELVNSGALRARREGWLLMVQPAIVSGAVPQPAPPRKQPSKGRKRRT